MTISRTNSSGTYYFDFLAIGFCSLHHYPKLIYGADFLDGKTMSFSPYLIPQPNFVRRAGWGNVCS